MTAQEAAALLGVSDARIRQLIDEGKLPAQKVGTGRRGIWLIRREDVEGLQDRPGPGRPPKEAQE